MPRYLFSIYQPDGPPPPPERLGPIMQDVAAFNAELRAAEAWVFAAGLTAAETASVVRTKGGRPVITDGPFTEAKEHLGGLTVIEAVDRAAALRWAEKLSAVLPLPIEVREMVEGAGA
jgi:hypothetical protein